MEAENQRSPPGFEIVECQTIDLDATGTDLHGPTLLGIAPHH
jgi:hypothetical protein